MQVNQDGQQILGVEDSLQKHHGSADYMSFVGCRFGRLAGCGYLFAVSRIRKKVNCTQSCLSVVPRIRNPGSRGLGFWKQIGGAGCAHIRGMAKPQRGVELQ